MVVFGFGLVVWGGHVLEHRLQVRLERLKSEHASELLERSLSHQRRAFELQLESQKRANAEHERHRGALKQLEDPWRGETH